MGRGHLCLGLYGAFVGKAGDVMQRYAFACEQLEHYDTAIEQWQLLARALPVQSPSWYPVQYHLILCHQLSGRTEKARDLLAYFQLQHPEIVDDHWRHLFSVLTEQLQPNGPDDFGTEPATNRGTDLASWESGEKK